MTDRIRILGADGSLLVELDDADSAELREKAAKAGMTPQAWLRDRLKSEWASLMRVN
jgi:hypothetical protein